jgi:HAMP domain-containing protein
VVSAQAIQIAGQLAIVLIAALALFGIFLLLSGRSITIPLIELVSASQQIADGKLNTTIEPHGDDENCRLGFAFGQMQIALKKRLDELSLLLDVSQDVSRSIDLKKGMPSVLNGALRGTGAAGVRAVVLNPSGGQPLTYGEGPANADMVAFDRRIMKLIRHRNELILSSPGDVIKALQNGHLPESNLKMLVALPLVNHERFQGVFWLTYRQNHHLDPTELRFLLTLSSQASVLVENARLYATTEGGRRRLAAVLASTSD